MKQKSVIIIGSGIAGLASAIRLAVQGHQVHVYEKNSYPGGKLSLIEKDGFRFDAGPSLFTQPANIEELFAFAGESLAPHFKYSSVDIACTYFFEDGSTFKAASNAEKFAADAAEEFTADKNLIEKYLKQSANVYKHIAEIFLSYSLHKKSTWFRKEILTALKHVKLYHLKQSLHQLNEKLLRHKKLVQIFNRYATYNGSNPYKAPAMLQVIPHLEYNEGVFYPKGGMISITNALYSLALKRGVHFHFNTKVERIIHDNGMAHGIVVNHNNIFADTIISNCDAYFTYKNLLKDDDTAAQLLKQERSSSALIFYWGIKKEFSQLGLHNILFASNYEEEFSNLFDLKNIYNDPTVYINITSKCEPELHAPSGSENWFVMINMPAGTTYINDDTIHICKRNIIGKINRLLKTDIEKYILTEDVLDPKLIELRTSSFGGSLYGTSSNSRWAAFLRHPNFSSQIKNLWFAGGSVHPGGGIPLCLRSAKIMCSLIADEHQKKQHD